MQCSVKLLLFAEGWNTLIHRDIFSVNDLNITHTSNSVHYLKRPPRRICKFAFFMHFFWTPFFLGFCQGLKSAFIFLLHSTIFHSLALFLLHSSGSQPQQIYANRYMAHWWWAMNLPSQGLFLITTAYQSLVGHWMYSKEQSAAAVDKIVRTLRVLDRLFLEIEVVFLICICAIRHD